jgi:hypothetical protein
MNSYPETEDDFLLTFMTQEELAAYKRDRDRQGKSFPSRERAFSFGSKPGSISTTIEPPLALSTWTPQN